MAAMNQSSLRKHIELELFGEPVAVEVDYRLIGIIERAFDDRSIFSLIPVLSEHAQLPVHRIAVIVADAVSTLPRFAHSRAEVLEEVTTAPFDTFRRNAASLLAAAMFTLRDFPDFGEPELEKSKSEIAASRKKKASPPSVST